MISTAPAETSRASRLSLPLVLWLAAAAISGFTARRFLGPLDEGILMQAATRMADGQWPWRDFGWSYGPGEPLVVMALGKLFGPSLLWWRLLRVIADATAALLVFLLVRDRQERWALPAWAAAAVTAAQPTSANPTAPALVFALGALLAATRGRPGWAGALAAAAAFWRPDVGAIAALAAAATLFVDGRSDRARRGAWVSRPGGLASRRAASRSAAITLAVAELVLLVLYAPFLGVAGPHRVWDALVVQATRDGEWWRLPFGFQGGDVKDFVTWLLPFAAVATIALAAKRAVGLAVLGAGAVVYFASRADLEHAQGLLIVAAAAAPFARPRAVGVAMLALLLAVGVANRASALLRSPDLEAFRGVSVPPREAESLPRLIADVRRRVAPGDPIYVAPLRSDLVSFSNPLLYYLVGRPNVLRRDVLLQAKPDEQAAIVRRLQATRPRVIVRWVAPESAKPEPNRRGRPSGSRALDQYIDATYREAARYGDYVVLVPR
ncbi:hypothetical protein [Solirubrobacter soli]|uniref:hypothetical protein n=1 Tax=Solirubrobacter soli TaxID=363832 RepID=UPI00041A0A42|nr:hypothetical protein [Solirubrobacter soli]